MILAVVANIVLSAIVFAAVIGLIMRTIRSQTPAVIAARPVRTQQPAWSRELRSAGLAAARPWA
jgi:hypothetical protein